MATVEMFLEEKERGLYFVKIEVGFPQHRRRELFAPTAAEALARAAEVFAEFKVDDRAGLKVMRPALQADIDRAQAAQEAAGDLTAYATSAEEAAEMGVEWRDGDICRSAPLAAVPGSMIRFEPKEPEFVDSSEIVRRKPGRPRKEA